MNLLNRRPPCPPNEHALYTCPKDVRRQEYLDQQFGLASPTLSWPPSCTIKKVKAADLTPWTLQLKARRFTQPSARIFIATALFFNGVLNCIPCTAESEGMTPEQYAAYVAEQNRKESQSRDNQAALAATMAGVGAGIAALSCMELYKAAEEAAAAGDTAQATLLRMQAAQQCSQAAQNLGNQGQNSGNSKQMQIPNMAASKQQQPTPPAAVAEEQPSAPLAGSDTPPDSVEKQIASDSSTAPPSSFEDKTSTALTKGTVAAAPADPKSLPSIPGQGITYDENARASSGTSGGSTTATSGSFFSSNGLGTSPNKLSDNSLFGTGGETPLSPELSHGKQRRSRANGVAAAGTESGTSEGDSAGGSNSFRSMLAGIMGGSAVESAASPSTGAGIEPSQHSLGKSTQKVPNIFEYANYRFRRLNRENEVGKAKPVRNLASAKP